MRVAVERGAEQAQVSPDYVSLYPPTTSINLPATQAVDQLRSVTGYVTSLSMNYTSTGFSTHFTLYVAADSG